MFEYKENYTQHWKMKYDQATEDFLRFLHLYIIAGIELGLVGWQSVQHFEDTTITSELVEGDSGHIAYVDFTLAAKDKETFEKDFNKLKELFKKNGIDLESLIIKL